ncbi:Severe Depolymerization of Actin, partial [Tulasnella sp. 419]
AEKGKKDHHQPNFPALQLLHDPQSFAEKLNDSLHRYDKRFSLDHKILIMQLLGRVTGTHKLCVLSFYTYIVKYLTYHQLKVTSILVSLAQSVHDLTPPDVLTPVIRKLAHEFVHPGVGSEVVAAGLNSIREICRRQPWCMEEDLLGDLIEYKKSKDKGVMNAARSLLMLYRDVNPGMLKRRERGKSGTIQISEGKTNLLPYGYTEKPAAGVAGLELLEEHFSRLRAEEGAEDGEDNMNEEDEWAGWEVDSSDSDSDSDSSSSGWISVSSDSNEDIHISDSEDEGEKRARAAKEPDVPAEPKEEKISILATTKILTPADFSLLNDLQLKAAEEEAKHGTTTSSSSKRKISELASKHKSSSANDDTTFLNEGDLLGPRKKPKSDYESRMASIQAGREGREKFGSHKGKKRKEVPSSTTNREKQKSKPFMMVLSSASVRSKKNMSLREKQKRLRQHIDRAKKSYK